VLSNYRLTTEGGAITPDTATASGTSVILGFNPGKLLVDTQYTLFLQPGLKDRAGNALEPSSPIGFRTALIQGQPGDRVAPVLTLANPADGTEDVDVNTSLVLQFNEPVRLSAAHLRFTSSGGDHSGPITVSPTSGFASLYVVSPGRLIGKTSYLVSISSEVKDQVGNPFGGRTLNLKTMDVQGLPGSDITPPRLLSASPTSGSSSVNPNTQILLAFSEQLSSTGSQVANYRITTSGGVYPIAGASMTGTSVILSFAGPLLVDTSYTLLLLPTLTDRAGNALAPTDPLTFRTALIQGQPGDRTPPRVATLNPADNSTGVGIHSEIYLTFSEAMNQTQMLSVSNYQLSTSGGSVPLTATFVNSSAVRLAPTVASLRGDTEYSLLLTSALTDLMGNPLSPVAVSFRTATATGVPGADFTAPTLVSSNPTSGTSDVDPNSLVVLVFSEEMGASAASASSYRFTTQTGVPIFPTNVTVTGTGVVLGFGAQGMLTETNYTLSLINLSDKAGNTLQPIAPITFRTATIPGKPGDRTVPSITAISPAANGVIGIYTQFYVTYSEAMGASAWSAGNYSLTTSGGLFPITVTYLSPTAVQISPTRVLIGNIGYKLSLSGGIQDLQGNRLQSRVFDYQSEDVPGVPGSDVTPPILGGSQPATGDENVDPYVSPVLGFSEALDPVTAQSVVNYTLTTDGALTESHPLTATVAGTNVVLEFGAPLLVNARYTIRLSNDIRDVAGNRLIAITPIHFHTRNIAGLPGDRTPPTVTSVNPADNTTVGVNSDLYITFSEPVNLTPTPSTAPFQLTTPGGVYPFTGSSRLNSSSLRLTPKKPLQGGITYNLVITSDITDTQGNPLVAFTSSFSAATVPGSAGSDFTAPTLLSANPFDGQQNVDPDTRIVLTFSEPMEISNLVTVGVTSTSNYRISSDSSSYTPTRVDVVASPPNSVSLNVGRLAANTTYAVILSNSLKDKAGNALVAQAIGFRTANVSLPGADSTPPQVSDSNPRNGSDSASLQTQITLIFNEPVNDISPTVAPPVVPVSAAEGLNSALWIGNYSFFSAFGDVGIAQVQKLGYPPNAYLLTPATTSLRGGTTYSLVPSNRILDKAGNGLISSQIAFTTVDQPGTGVGDVTPPQVISVQPPNDAQVINPNTNIIFTFSEEMYEAGLLADTYSVTSTGNWTILAPYDKEAATAADQQVPTRIEKLSVPPNAYRVDFGTPDNALPRTDCYYIVELSNRIRDLAGNPLTPTKIAFQQGSPPTKPKVDSTSIDNSPIATNAGEFITVTFNKQVTDAGGDGNANNFELLGYCTDITGTASEVIQIASVNPVNSNDGSPRQAFQLQLRGATLQGADFRLIKNASYVLVVKGYHALVSGTDYINQADYSKTYRALNQ
jgi:methionine-rich copper-binding protein CopC